MIDFTCFDNYSAAEYYDAVSFPDEPPVEAVYYLLQKRLRRTLQRMFKLHGYGLNEDFNDTIDDFFLYLYKGNDGGKPFAIVIEVRHYRQKYCHASQPQPAKQPQYIEQHHLRASGT